MLQEVVNCNEMEWQPAQSYPPGAMSKILRDDHGHKTILLKVPVGFQMPAHSHTSLEQHYVLEGSYEIEGRAYGPGTYQLIPPGFAHGPFDSKDGAVLLVVWDPIQEELK